LAGYTDNTIYNTTQALVALSILGVEKDASKKVLETALKRYAGIDKTASKSVSVYGVRDDYVVNTALDKKEKDERIYQLYKQAALQIKTDLTKVASVISDPEAVDVMLSLNFVNADNLQDFINNINPMKKIVERLACMLCASRMGLGDLPEDALKQSMDAMQKVIEGLENIKIALGK
jgi:hypothetical protein